MATGKNKPSGLISQEHAGLRVSDAMTKVCRRCATPNSVDNAYCRKCGVVLDVRTSEIRAQRKPVMPKLHGIRWRFVLIGLFVMLGILSFLSGASLAVGRALGFGGGGIRDIVSNIVTIGGVAAVLFFFAFGTSGAVLTWLARSVIAREMAISTTLVIALFGVVGSFYTSDLIIVSGLLLIPSVIAAVLGARLTRCGDKGGQ